MRGSFQVQRIYWIGVGWGMRALELKGKLYLFVFLVAVLLTININECEDCQNECLPPPPKKNAETVDQINTIMTFRLALYLMSTSVKNAPQFLASLK